MQAAEKERRRLSDELYMGFRAVSGREKFSVDSVRDSWLTFSVSHFLCIKCFICMFGWVVAVIDLVKMLS